ncbi:hypothetical protein [Gordonia sp. 852002-50395_SCH5434458]|uniref:hypothetical protein n=1 Tax=Gordonia sp. 852002-50395_SCH5434458 TaxID=1834090 RepID=UPI0007E9DF1A|nr:hypothetical protein [Gordonia sp. 852002-50395_SCH5434458]OBC02706.1 hypothetical protein A5785_02520 [Gordonia sp. 852002-50395_SCH5434458]
MSTITDPQTTVREVLATIGIDIPDHLDVVLTDVRTGPRIATYRVSPSQVEAGCEQHWLVTGETVNAAALVEALPWHD